MFSRPDRRLQAATVAAIIALLAIASAGAAVGLDTFRAGELLDRGIARIDRFLAGPPPDRATVAITVDDSPDPVATPSPSPTPVPTATPSLVPGETPPGSPMPTPAPTPVPRTPVDVNIVAKPKAVFASEIRDTWCSPAGVQMTLAVLGLANTSDAFQSQLQGKVRTWESYKDSHNGDWGPGAMALALDAYGAHGYEVRGYKSRNNALRDAARAIQATHSPVILLAWRGAHTWVMTGFRADADPTTFKDANVSGAYILDPWYPRISSIWGRSDPPGTFQDTAEMIRNYLVWQRPEGHYADKDGLFIAVVPTVPAPAR